MELTKSSSQAMRDLPEVQKVPQVDTRKASAVSGRLFLLEKLGLSYLISSLFAETARSHRSHENSEKDVANLWEV